MRGLDRCSVETAFIIWPVTVALGMVLRNLVFDRGTALPFIIVATLVLGVFLVGWRMVVAGIAGRRHQPRRNQPGSLSSSGPCLRSSASVVTPLSCITDCS